MIYSDASCEPGSLPRLGWVIFEQGHQLAGYTIDVPAAVFETWLAQKQQIFPAETLCGNCVPATCAERLRGKSVLWFIDNEAAASALIRGSSSQPDALELVMTCHMQLQQLQTRCWWEWIDTASNPSDGLSRLGLDDPWTCEQGWALAIGCVPSFFRDAAPAPHLVAGAEREIVKLWGCRGFSAHAVCAMVPTCCQHAYTCSRIYSTYIYAHGAFRGRVKRWGC